MKKIWRYVLVTGIMFVWLGEARALLVGDEIVAGKSYTAIPFSKFQIAGEAELILERKLKPDTGNRDKKMTSEGERFVVKTTISPFENIDLYAKGGFGQDKLENTNKNLKIDSGTGAVYGGGLRANLMNLEESGFRLGLDAQYLRLDAGIDNVNLNSTNYSSASGNFTVDQWQAALFLVKEFFQFTIYGGGDYASSILKYNYSTSDNLSGNDKAKNDKTLGVLAGLNINVTDTVAFFAEGHFIDETSVSFGLNARF